MREKTSKEIVQRLIDEEALKTGVRPNIIISTNKLENLYYILRNELENKLIDNKMTFFEFFSNIIWNIKCNKKWCADYDYIKSSIKILIYNLKKDTENKNEYLWQLITSVYHEYKHALIDDCEVIDCNSHYDFNLLISSLIMEIEDGNFYNNYHDEFYEEIQAEKYAVKKSIEFLKRNVRIYKELCLYAESERLNIEIYDNNYDVQKFLNKLNKIVKNTYNKSSLFQQVYPYTIIPVLYNEDGTLKDLSSLNDEYFWNNNISLETKYLIVSSKMYLDCFNYDNATYEEINFIFKALNYTYNLEQKRKFNNIKLHREIDLFNSSLAGKDDLFIYKYMLEKKELYNNKKLKYLELQIEKVSSFMKIRKKDMEFKSLTRRK